MKLLIPLLLLLALPVQAESLVLNWDKVTTNVLGEVIPEPQYRVYRKLTTGENWKLVGTREGASYTWYYPTPAYGRYTYRVTAFDENGESLPSNEVRVYIDTKPKEEL